MHLCLQAQRAEADIFVVRDPGNLPPCTRVALLIRGGWACDHSYLASGGSRGCLLHFSRMWRARRRELWVSVKFKGYRGLHVTSLGLLKLPSSGTTTVHAAGRSHSNVHRNYGLCIFYSFVLCVLALDLVIEVPE